MNKDYFFPHNNKLYLVIHEGTLMLPKVLECKNAERTEFSSDMHKIAFMVDKNEIFINRTGATQLHSSQIWTKSVICTVCGSGDSEDSLCTRELTHPRNCYPLPQFMEVAVLKLVTGKP